MTGLLPLDVTPDTFRVNIATASRPTKLSALKTAGVPPTDPAWLTFLTGEAQILSDTCSPEILQKGGGFEDVTVETDYISPYLDLLTHRTGQTLDVPLRFPCLTDWTDNHFLDWAELRGRVLTARLIIRVYPLPPASPTHPMTAEARRAKAITLAHYILALTLGTFRTQPEFLPVNDRGLYQRNPAYGRSSCDKAAAHEGVWQTLFGAWVTCHSTEKQRAILNRFTRGHHRTESWPTLHDETLSLDQYRTSLTWEQFQRGHVPPTPNLPVL